MLLMKKQSAVRLARVFDCLYPGPDVPPLPRRCAPGVWRKRGQWSSHLAGPVATEANSALTKRSLIRFFPAWTRVLVDATIIIAP